MGIWQGSMNQGETPKEEKKAKPKKKRGRPKKKK